MDWLPILPSAMPSPTCTRRMWGTSVAHRSGGRNSHSVSECATVIMACWRGEGTPLIAASCRIWGLDTDQR